MVLCDGMSSLHWSRLPTQSGWDQLQRGLWFLTGPRKRTTSMPTLKNACKIPICCKHCEFVTCQRSCHSFCNLAWAEPKKIHHIFWTWQMNGMLLLAVQSHGEGLCHLWTGSETRKVDVWLECSCYIGDRQWLNEGKLFCGLNQQKRERERERADAHVRDSSIDGAASPKNHLCKEGNCYCFRKAYICANISIRNSVNFPPPVLKNCQFS